MTCQKLHYEHLGGLLIRRDGVLHWRCPDCEKWGVSKDVMATCPYCKNVNAKPVIEPEKSPPSIAQSIRDAAINWPKYIGHVEYSILDYAFNGTGEGFLSMKFREDETSARTFMLFVAEALE